MSFLSLCCDHKICHQYIYKFRPLQMSCIDNDVIFTQLLEVFKSKNTALFSERIVFFSESLADLLLPFLQELRCFLNVVLLSVIHGSLLTNGTSRFHFQRVIGLLNIVGTAQEKDIGFFSLQTIPIAVLLIHTVV